MDLGVWMSRGVLAHKRGDEESLQAWNLKSLPDELSAPPEPHRLFIATEGFWRGYFVLEPYVSCNFADTVRWVAQTLKQVAPRREIASSATPSRSRPFR